jgi:hypothetical protein
LRPEAAPELTPAAGAGISSKPLANRGNPDDFHPENDDASSLMMWREQGKDQMPQCFTGKTRLRRYFLRMG